MKLCKMTKEMIIDNLTKPLIIRVYFFFFTQSKLVIRISADKSLYEMLKVLGRVQQIVFITVKVK